MPMRYKGELHWVHSVELVQAAQPVGQGAQKGLRGMEELRYWPIGHPDAQMPEDKIVFPLTRVALL